MEQTTCNSKEELIVLLKNWLNTGEETIGNGQNQTGNTVWVTLNLKNNKYFINADTKREGIEVFVRNHEGNYPWRVISNNRNKAKKVSNDINAKAIKYLYFYSATEGQREF